jgi:anti-sigma factor RsiW
MSDCPNVEMRELLPEYLHDALDASTSERVRVHLASCEECAAELEAMRAVRSAFSRTPSIDASKIVAALPRPRARSTTRLSRDSRFPTWRVAAALAIVSVGGMTLALARKAYTPQPIDSVVSATAGASAVADSPTSALPTDRTAASGAGESGAETRPTLSFGGGVDDLETDEIEALIDLVDGLEVTFIDEPEYGASLVPQGDSTL